MFLKHCHAVLKILDDVRRRLVGLAKRERHGGELPRATKQRTVHLRSESQSKANPSVRTSENSVAIWREVGFKTREWEAPFGTALKLYAAKLAQMLKSVLRTHKEPISGLKFTHKPEQNN